jgi:transcriptional regulator with XRE-family HTH domain
MTLGVRISQLRKATGLSQEELAEMVSVSRQAISKWETDQTMPEIEKVLLLSKTFSISTDELLGNEAPIKAEISSPQLIDIVESNVKKRQLALGWITAVVGLVLLIAEYFSLWVIYYNATRLDLEYPSEIGHYSDPMAYASIEPFPIIFMITMAIIAIGIGLAIYSYIGKKKLRKV